MNTNPDLNMNMRLNQNGNVNMNAWNLNMNMKMKSMMGARTMHVDVNYTQNRKLQYEFTMNRHWSVGCAFQAG